MECELDKCNPRLSYSRDTLTQLLLELELRQIRVVVDQPGYRTTGFFIVTTLLDPIKYPSEEIAKLYLERWDVKQIRTD